MVKYKYLRIIAVIFVAVIFCLIISKLLSNSIQKLNVFYSGDYAYTISQTIVNIQQQQLDVQSVIQEIAEKNKDIISISLIEGRYFIAHSDISLVGNKISKEQFDSQRTLEKNLVVSETEAPYVIWKESTEQPGTYIIYFPIQKENKLLGMIVLQTNKQTIYSQSISRFMIIATIIILAFFIILLDRLIPKLSFILGTLVFIAVIFFLTNQIGNQLQLHLNGWNYHKTEIFDELQDDLIQRNIYVSVQPEPLELPLKESVKYWNFTLSFFGSLLWLFILTGIMRKFIDALIEHRLAYAYIMPAMFGVFLLVFFPFVYGILIGFTDYNLTNFGGDLIQYFSDFKNYGFDNFYNILKVVNFTDYQNFYYTLTHTIIWTVTNLFFHITIGVVLAILLNDVRLKGRTVFRILLILPWAIPNYITALIWRGMFHKQFGAVNGLLELLGFESISWFTQPITAFLTNLATNVWLGFPFMMIIALGALQSIPKELYEASAIDGSTKWQSFWNVTVPLLRPAMVPAIILGTIWTFNQFNVIYLVSGGGPDGSTELLITDAYKLAFEQYRYGYAAAYCIIIFAVLFSYGIITSKLTHATKGAYE